MSNAIKTLAKARERIAALEAQLNGASVASVEVAPKVVAKFTAKLPEAKPTVDSIVAKFEDKSITFSEAMTGLQAIAKGAKPADKNRAFKAIARVQKAEAL